MGKHTTQCLVGRAGKRAAARDLIVGRKEGRHIAHQPHSINGNVVMKRCRNRQTGYVVFSKVAYNGCSRRKAYAVARSQTVGETLRTAYNMRYAGINTEGTGNGTLAMLKVEYNNAHKLHA